MFVQLLRKSILRRKSRFAMGVVSVLIGAAVVTALLTVSLGVGDQVGQEFTKYGANLILQPQSNTIEIGLPGVKMGSVTEQKYIDESDLWMIKTIQYRANVLGFAPFLYQMVTVGDGPNAQEAVMAGTYFNKTIQIIQPASLQDPSEFTTGIADVSSWWKVTGNWITDQNDTMSAMVGSNVAQKLNLTVGDSFKVSYAEAQNGTAATNVKDLKVAGIVESGGAEDNQIFVNLPVAQDLSSRPGKVDTVQVSALCVSCPVEDIASEIQGKIPGVEGTTIKQLTNAEMGMLDKYQSMMALVTAVASARFHDGDLHDDDDQCRGAPARDRTYEEYWCRKPEYSVAFPRRSYHNRPYWRYYRLRGRDRPCAVYRAKRIFDDYSAEVGGAGCGHTDCDRGLPARQCTAGKTRDGG